MPEKSGVEALFYINKYMRELRLLCNVNGMLYTLLLVYALLSVSAIGIKH